MHIAPRLNLFRGMGLDEDGGSKPAYATSIIDFASFPPRSKRLDSILITLSWVIFLPQTDC